jgi:6-pyruvoyltetrahydropterin/6-carboxytetrahydropterin synthase
MIALTRRYRFSASHRLHSPELSDAQNERLYGKCNNPYGHGHDYVLEVTATGEVNPATGLLIPVAQQDRLVTEKVLRLFAYRYINIDVSAFRTQVPTTENVALYIADVLEKSWASYIPDLAIRISRVHLRETDRNSFEVAVGDRLRGAIGVAQRDTVLAGS